MITLTLHNIFEELKTNVVKFFKDVYDTQKKLVENNKVKPVDVDINMLKKPKIPFSFEDINNDIIKSFIFDKQIGFTVAQQMMQNPNKYIMQDGKKETNISCWPYFYNPDKNTTYFAGLLMYDKSAVYVKDFIHIVLIESSLIVSKSDTVCKAMLNDFTDIMKKSGTYIGMTAAPEHPKAKAILVKLGFTSMKDNKNVLTYKIK